MRHLVLIAALLLMAFVPAGAARDGGSVPKSPPRGAILFSGGPASRVYAVDARGGPLKEVLSSLAAPVWSPDGEMLAFVDSSYDLHVRRTRGSETKPLARDVRSKELTWSPDGTKIAFVERSGIGVIRSDGTRRRQLTTGPDDRGPVWSPDGRKIAFWRDRTGDSDSLVVIDPDTGRLLATPIDHVDIERGSLSWSPDGGRLAFALAEERAVHVWHARSRSRSTVSANAAASLAWSPDGRWIALAGHVGPENGMFLARPDGTGLKRISGLGRLFERPSWSPDSRWLAIAWDGDIWVVPVTGGRARRVTQGWRYSYFNADPQWHPRGLPTARLRGEVVPWGNPTDSVADGSVLRTTHHVFGLAADGRRAALALAEGPPSSLRGRVELWEPSNPLPTRILEGRGEDGIALAGDRVALLTRSVGGKGPSDFWTLWTATAAVPNVVQVRYQPSAAVTEPVGDGALLVFSEWGPCSNTNPCRTGPKRNGKLFRFQGSKTIQIAASSGALTPLSVDAGRFVVDREDGRLELLRSDGSSLRTFRYVPGNLRGAKLQGRDLVLLSQGSLEHYDAETGERLHEWPVVAGEPRLEDVHGGIAVYVSGSYVYLVRLADGATVALPSRGAKPFAQLEGPGLFYAYRVGDATHPGRVAFIPFDELPLR